VGAIGGAVFIASLLLPAEAQRGGQMEIVQRFGLLENSGTLGLGITVLVCTALGVAASVLCLINVGLWASGRGLALTAFWLLFTSLLVRYFAVPLIRLLGRGEVPGEVIVPILLFVCKAAAWSLGILLLAPAGLADLIVNVSRAGAGVPAGAGAGWPAGPAGYGPAPAPAPAPWAPAPPAPPAGGGAWQAQGPGDAAQQLQRLQDMLSRGLISPTEYERKRIEILSRM